jgi:cytochrome b561/polyisoprenoid-binding protein YceI
MSRSNTAHSYGSVAKTFHWLSALLIITVIPLGIIANDMGYDTSEQLARKFLLFSLHKTVGVTIFFVALARIIWAISQPKPNSLHPGRKAETWLAETIHWLLYGSLVMAPLAGWIHHAATTGFAPIWWPFGQSMPFVSKNETTAELFSALHLIFSRVMVVSILLHVAGALKHVVIDKDGTLSRMWFGKSSATETTGGHSNVLPIASALVAWAAAIAIGVAAGMFSAGAHDDHEHAQDGAQETAVLEIVASDWTVQSGEIAITVDQGGSKITGSFAEWTAAITFDPETGLGNTEVTIVVPSLTLGSLSGQAMGADYFNAEAFPTAVFKAVITPSGDSHVATGTLRIRDIEMPIEMPFSLSTEGEVTTMQAALTLDRQDYAIGSGLKDEQTLKFAVGVEINLSATQN